MADAKVRVRLDTAQARQDLRALYGEMGRPPSIPARGGVSGVPGVSGGGGGAGSALAAGGGALAGGGLGLTGVVAAVVTAVGLRDTLSTAGSAIGAMTGGVSSTIEEFLFGNTGPRIKGLQNTSQELQNKLGLARGLGAINESGVQGIFDALSPIRVAEQEGRKAIERQFKGQIAEDTAEGLLDRIANALDSIHTFLKGLVF